MEEEKKMAMTTISFEVPSAVADTFGATAAARSRFATEALVIEAFRRGLETKGCLAAIVGIPRLDFNGWLIERRVPTTGRSRRWLKARKQAKGSSLPRSENTIPARHR